MKNVKSRGFGREKAKQNWIGTNLWGLCVHLQNVLTSVYDSWYHKHSVAENMSVISLLSSFFPWSVLEQFLSNFPWLVPVKICDQYSVFMLFSPFALSVTSEQLHLKCYTTVFPIHSVECSICLAIYLFPSFLQHHISIFIVRSTVASLNSACCLLISIETLIPVTSK